MDRTWYDQSMNTIMHLTRGKARRSQTAEGSLKEKLLHLPVFYKILVANSVLVFLAALAEIWFFHLRYPGFALEAPTVVILSVVLLGSIAANSIILHLALTPFQELSDTMNKIAKGDFHLRARYHPLGEKLVNRAVESLNKMLNALEQAYKVLENEKEHSRHQAKRILVAQEEERKRIARELHDETSQVLATLLLGLEQLQRKMPMVISQCASCKGDLGRLKVLTDQTLTELHRLTFNLRPSLLDDMGLKQALTWLLREQIERKGIKVDFTWDGLESHLPAEIEIALFRVAQEAFTNIVKYAKAKQVILYFKRDAGQVEMNISDDGIGFDPEFTRRDRERQLGIFGMEERVSLLSGYFQLESAPGQGTSIHVAIPLPVHQIQKEPGQN